MFFGLNAEARFAWDWAFGVPELLLAGETRYLIGHETLGWWDGGAWASILPDALGSVRQWVDANGAVTYAGGYTPYGEPLWQAGSTESAWGFTGEWWDTQAQMLYLRARWMQPRTGGFTQVDPIAGLLGWGGSYNPYGYADQNPINRVDPSGLLSNETIVRSFGVGSFEEVLAIIELSGDWGYLKMLQDAEVGDRVYAGPFSWTSYLGTIECYDSSRHNPEPWYWPGPWEGGIVFVTPHGEEHLIEQSKRTETYAHYTVPSYPPDWYCLNNNQYAFSSSGQPLAYTTKTDYGWLPDYVIGYGGVPLVKLAGIVGIGGNVYVAVDRFGSIYVGGAFDLSAGFPWAGGIALGWLNQNGLTGDSWVATPAEIQGFLEGWGGGVAGYLVVGGGLAYNYDFPRGLFAEAIGGEAGIAIPTFGWTFVSRLWRISQAPELEWDWVDRYPIEHGYGRQDIRLVDDRPADCGCQ